MNVEHVYKLEIHCIEHIIENFTYKGIIKAIKEICRKCKSENIPANQLKIYEDTRLGLEYYEEDTLDIEGISTAIIKRYGTEPSIPNTTEDNCGHLREVANESGAYSENELQINEDTLYYCVKLEIFVRVDQHHNVVVSKNIASYACLETYADIYRMLIDLDFDSDVINEIFLTDDSSSENPLYFVGVFANVIRKELNHARLEFKTQANKIFLEELAIKPNLACFMAVTDKLHKAITKAQSLATVKFVVTDDDTAHFYKEIYSSPEQKSININLLVDCPTDEWKVF